MSCTGRLRSLDSFSNIKDAAQHRRDPFQLDSASRSRALRTFWACQRAIPKEEKVDGARDLMEGPSMKRVSALHIRPSRDPRRRSREQELATAA